MLTPDIGLPFLPILGYGFLIPLGIMAGKAIYNKVKGDGKGDVDEEEAGAVSPYLKQLQGSSQGLRQQGQDLSGQGSQAMQPALQYLQQLLSSDPSQVQAATAPERGRVIDQYDAARRAVGQFSPRGGGTTSAMAESRISEADTLADITNTSRREAFGQSMAFGQALTGLGLTAEQLASADIEKIIDTILTQQGHDVQKRGQNMQMWAGLGQAAGYAAGSYLGGD